jgi:hypothetical protein
MARMIKTMVVNPLIRAPMIAMAVIGLLLRLLSGSK